MYFEDNEVKSKVNHVRIPHLAKHPSMRGKRDRFMKDIFNNYYFIVQSSCPYTFKQVLME